MRLALIVSLLAAPAAERPAHPEGKVLILASADMVANDFLSQGKEFTPNARFIAQVVEAFCLDPRILRIPEAASPGGERKASPAFEEILKELPGPVEAHYYASSVMPPGFKDLRAETEAGLESLAAASGGRLRFEVIDPEAKAGELGAEKGKDYLADLQKRGISPDVDARAERGPKAGRFYSAIEVRSGKGSPQLIARHHQPALLEQELAKRVVLLSRDERPRVVFFDGLGEGASAPAKDEEGRIQTSSHSAILKALGDLLAVEESPLHEGSALSDATGAPISCLIVARPHDLEERQIYEIQWAVNSGIPTIFLISAFTLDASEPGLKQSYPISPLRSGLGTLFLDWGVSLGTSLVASNVCGSLPVPRQLERDKDKVPVPKKAGSESGKSAGGADKSKKETVRAPRALPVLVKSKGDSLRQKHPLLAGIGELIFPATSGLSIAREDLKRAGLRATVLADSGKQSFTVRLFGLRAELKSDKTASSGPPAVLLLKELSEPRKPTDPFIAPQPLAVLLEGKFPKRAPGLAIPPWKK